MKIKFSNLRHNLKIDNSFLLLIPFFLLTILFLIVPLIMILVYSLTPQEGATVQNNWDIVNNGVVQIIGKSLKVSLLSTLFSVLIGLPFAFLLARIKNANYKLLISLLVFSPLWISTLVKIIGLKTFFEILESGSLHGDAYTIIGTTYMYIPFFIMPVFSTFSSMPNELIEASHDLGRKRIATFCNVVIPYARNAIISGITLVLLPTFTTVAIPLFLNSDVDHALIGNFIYDNGIKGLAGGISLSRTSSLSIVMSLVMIAIFGIIVGIPHLSDFYKKAMRKKMMEVKK